MHIGQTICDCYILHSIIIIHNVRSNQVNKRVGLIVIYYLDGPDLADVIHSSPEYSIAYSRAASFILSSKMSSD